MHITRSKVLTALAGAGILLGATGLASAATGTSPSNTATGSAPSVTTAHDQTDANESNDANESDDANDAADEHDGDGHDNAYTSSITVADNSEPASEADEQAQLAKLATVTTDEASAAALAAHSGTVSDVQLENEDGNVVYSVVVDTGSGSVDVKIDPGNAKVLASEPEHDDGHDSAGDTEVADD